MVAPEKPLGILAPRLPGPLVEGSHRAHHPYSVEMFQIQQVVQRPVQVIGEVGDLLPQCVGGIAHHAAHLARGISSTAPRRARPRSAVAPASPAPAKAPAKWAASNS